VKREPLGNTGIDVTRLGFGCWQLGGKGWGLKSGDDPIAAVGRALELGVNLFDTAPIYGFGHSEERLGKALPAAAEDVVIVSKGGLVWDSLKRVAHDNRPASLRVQLEGTLKRLRRERLDIFLLHWPDRSVPLLESAAALEALRDEGKIRAWGVSNFDAADVLSITSRSLILEYPVNCIERYDDEYQASAKAAAELLPLAESRAWGGLAFDSLARGLLGGHPKASASFGKRDIRSRDSRYCADTLTGNLLRAGKVAALARSLGVPVPALAIRAVLERPGVTACIVGMKGPGQVDENAASLSVELPGDVRTALAQL
jgi:aryl-alcohol dehydrogenase-like predicted oxidoreductase